MGLRSSSGPQPDFSYRLMVYLSCPPAGNALNESCTHKNIKDCTYNWGQVLFIVHQAVCERLTELGEYRDSPLNLTVIHPAKAKQ